MAATVTEPACSGAALLVPPTIGCRESLIPARVFVSSVKPAREPDTATPPPRPETARTVEASLLVATIRSVSTRLPAAATASAPSQASVVTFDSTVADPVPKAITAPAAAVCSTDVTVCVSAAMRTPAGRVQPAPIEASVAPSAVAEAEFTDTARTPRATPSPSASGIGRAAASTATARTFDRSTPSPIVACRVSPLTAVALDTPTVTSPSPASTTVAETEPNPRLSAPGTPPTKTVSTPFVAATSAPAATVADTVERSLAVASECETAAPMPAATLVATVFTVTLLPARASTAMLPVVAVTFAAPIRATTVSCTTASLTDPP